MGTPRISRWLLCALAAMTAGTGFVPPAQAQAAAPASVVEGYVVAVQGADIIVDVARQRGAQQADVVELWRPILVRHPITKKQVRDRFRIGALQLKQVRDNLSLARAVGQLDRTAEPGDVVILRRHHAAPSPRPAPAARTPAAGASASDKPKPSRSAPASDKPNARPAAAQPRRPRRARRQTHAQREAQQVAQLFERQRGATPARRIEAYEGWVRSRPNSRYSAVLREEAALLRQLAAKRVRQQRDRGVAIDAFEPPKRVLIEQPVTLALRIYGRPRGLLLHYRKTGETGYQTRKMRRSGPGYYSVRLRAVEVFAEGVEYFMEAITPDGKRAALVGNAKAPEVLDVFVPPSPKVLRPPRATVALWSDYADYNRLRGNDVAWQTEGYFGMRFGDTGMRAVRTGFGVYRGVGGSLDELDELGLSARKIGFTYGYLEGEVGFSDFVGLGGRGVVGLEDEGITGGGQLILRLGHDLKTNIQLGGEILGGVGLRGFAQLDLRVIDNVPMMFRTEVTNQPAGVSASAGSARPDDPDASPEDVATDTNSVGVRGIVQVGYRFVDALEVSLRASYQGRTINHAGPGLGGAVSYVW